MEIPLDALIFLIQIVLSPPTDLFVPRRLPFPGAKPFEGLLFCSVACVP